MSRDKKLPHDKKTYSTPSVVADLFATFVGLALVYGMIALVGNAPKVERAVAAPQEGYRSDKNSGVKTYHIAQKQSPKQSKTGQAASSKPLKEYTRGKLAAFFIYKSPKPLPEFTYIDEQGKDHSLKELRGKVVLLNLWATWCGPCRHEMPWLDEVQKKYGGEQFEMLTISIDRGGLKKPRRFFNSINIKNLTLYGDKTGRLASKLRAFGMPTTLLIDRQGRELGRIAGPAEWASSEAFAFIEAAISRP